MRFFFRYFFKTLRLVLTPFMLLNEKLTTPKGVERSSERQQQVNEACQNLALYQFKTCPFCIKVRREMARLNLPIEKRDAQHNLQFKGELLEGGGRVKVPCLRIQHAAANVEWLYESDAINNWLRENFQED